MDEFPGRLNQIMKEKGLSPAMLAIKTGMSDRMIRNYQKGTSTPGSYSLKMLARALGVSMDWLMGIEEERK